MKRLLLFLIFAQVLSSCVKFEGSLKVYPAKEYLVASVQSSTSDGMGNRVPYYLTKEKGSDVWVGYEHIQGFEYKRGFEYRIIAEKVEDNELRKLADSYYIFLRLVKVVSVEKKETEDLPGYILPYNEDMPSPAESRIQIN